MTENLWRRRHLRRNDLIGLAPRPFCLRPSSSRSGSRERTRGLVNDGAHHDNPLGAVPRPGDQSNNSPLTGVLRANRGRIAG